MITMNDHRPPGTAAIAGASYCEKPDCVIAQAIAVAAPTISRIAPDSDAVSHQHRTDAPPVELAIDQQAHDHRVDDADGRDLGRGRHALDDGSADDERQRQRRARR